MDRSTNDTACVFSLMWRCYMGAHTGPAGISSFHTAVTPGFTTKSNGGGSQPGTATVINKRNVGPVDRYQ